MAYANASDLNKHVKLYQSYKPEQYMQLLTSKLKEQYPNAKLLSKKYEGINKFYSVLCESGKHEINIKDYYIINRNFLCSPCSKFNANQNTKTKLLQDIAKIYGGECLSKEYLGQKIKLSFKCKNGHIWSPLYANIVEHCSWCPECPRLPKATKQLVVEKITKLKSKYKPVTVKSTYTTSEQIYVNKYKDIYSAGNMFALEEKLCGVWENARLKDNVFRGYCIGYPVICNVGHDVLIRDDNIMSGNFTCRNCNQFDPNDLNKLKQIAGQKNGKLLTETYKGDQVSMMWECSSGHKWEATPNNIKRGSWCPTCLSYTNEERCRVVLNKLLDANLEKCRPGFLRYPETDTCLELDGYDIKLDIAFEYNGIQHYEEMFYDDKTDLAEGKDRLQHQKNKDAFKVGKCQELGIKLLIIPYTEIKNKTDKNTITYLIKLCQDSGFVISEDRLKEIQAVNIQSEMPHTSKSDKFEQLVLNILNKRKATLIKINPGDKISSNRTQFKIKCRFGHETVKTYENINDKRDRWCPQCTKVLLKPVVDSKNSKLKSAAIIEMDRFGACTVSCNNCYNKTSNVDIDNVSDTYCPCHAEINNQMSIHEKLNLLWTKIINRLNDMRDSIRAMDQSVDEFNNLYANGNVKYCNKGHWAHVDCFGDSDMCCSCMERAKLNYSKHKHCIHGKRIGKDRRCSDCLAADAK